MRFVVFILVLFSFSMSAQEVFILDSISRSPVENVNLFNKNAGGSSNNYGMVDLRHFNKNDTIEIKHISYYNKKIVKSKIGDIILLSPKMKVLPTINFIEEKKFILDEDVILICSTVAQSRKAVSKSTSKLLESNAGITIQESQSGGGSPNYRGMEANRLLLVVDGVPINNTIYRSGHLQSTATINPYFIDKINLVAGPASVAYGNGAMGGALLFYTKTNTNITTNNFYFHQQYESATNGVFLNFLAEYHYKKVVFTSGFSVKKLGNLKMGSNRAHDYANWGAESVSTRGNEQLFTAYKQADFMHKTHYKINDFSTLLFNTQYALSSDINRFDKLNDIKENTSKYANWYYGPQGRFLQSVKHSYFKATTLFDALSTLLAYQDVSESRHKQKTWDELLSNRYENVKIYDFALDFKKGIKLINLTYGIGSRLQKVDSKANNTNKNNIEFYNTTRYPDGGSIVKDYFAYSQIKIPLTKKADFKVGIRLNNNLLNAKFMDTTIFTFAEVNNSNASFIKSATFMFKATDKSTLSASYYGGFRNPNIDDIGKIFSKNDADVIIPNENLEPEYADNFELVFKFDKKKLHVETALFYTFISNAIKREYGTLNGIDSITYDGELMRVQMNKNIESATIKGVNLSGVYYPNKHLSFTANYNYLIGRTANDKALAHIPPINLKLSAKYIFKKHEIEFYTNYNAIKKAEDYDESGVDNFEEATIDGTPMWYTLNMSYSRKINSNFILSYGVENILDRHYKAFGSGISASGRNFVVSLHANF